MSKEKSECYSCRWFDRFAPFFEDATLVLDKSVGDYQGHVWVVFGNINWGDECCLVSYYYGSCSGCDSWEGESIDKILKEMADHVHVFVGPDELYEFIEDEKNDEIPYSHEGERADLIEELKAAFKSAGV